MKAKILCIALAFAVSGLEAQTIGEFKPKDQSFGVSKAKGQKRVFISNFTVNYQVYNEQEDFKQGGRMLGGGGYKGDALAKLSVGLDGLSKQDAIDITNKLYEEYVQKLKSKGYEIVSIEEAAKIPYYADYTRVAGGEVSMAQFPGTLAVSPTGYEYFVKKITDKGKEKTGGFAGVQTFTYPNISKQLDDAIIADVKLFVLFVEDKGEGIMSMAGASIRAKTNLRLAGEGDYITATKEAKIKLKGSNTFTPVVSTMGFYQGKAGLAPAASYTGTARPVQILNVIDDKKLQAFARNQADFSGVNAGLYTFFNPENRESKSTNTIQVDPKLYKEGVYLAAKKFIDHHSDNFLSKQ